MPRNVERMTQHFVKLYRIMSAQLINVYIYCLLLLLLRSLILNGMHIAAVERRHGPVIPTSARIGSLGLGRFPYSRCGWVPLRPSDSDFGQNWKPRTGEIPLISLWLGATEAQWFRLRPELEARDRGDSPTLTVVGCHWGPLIPTSARIGSPGPGRFPYSHCGWVPLRPSDSDFSQNWKPRTGEIPLLSLWLGATEAQWFRLRPELEAWDQGDSPTLTVVGCHWGPVIRTSARIGSPRPGRFPYSHCGWVPLRPSDSDFGQNWKPRTREIPLLSLWLGTIEAQWFRLRPELETQDRDIPLLFSNDRKWSLLVHESQAIHTPLGLWQVELHWWTHVEIVYGWDSNQGYFDPVPFERPNNSTIALISHPFRILWLCFC
jgi:hypothetical protein